MWKFYGPYYGKIACGNSYRYRFIPALEEISKNNSKKIYTFFLFFLLRHVDFSIVLMGFMKNMRIFNHFIRKFWGYIFSPQFSHFIEFLLQNISDQIVEIFHNCGKFGHTTLLTFSVWRPACGFIASTLDDWDCTRTCTRFPSPSLEWLSRTNSEPSCYYCKLCRQGRTSDPFIYIINTREIRFDPLRYVPIKNMSTTWRRTLR